MKNGKDDNDEGECKIDTNGNVLQLTYLFLPFSHLFSVMRMGGGGE